MRKTASLLPLAMLAACDGASTMPPAKAQPVLDPIAYFTGQTRGEGVIKVVFRAGQSLGVESRGVSDRHGGVIVTQRIEEGDKSRVRRWHLRPTRPGYFSGTLTDAIGPVTASVWGNTLRIAYHSKDGLAMEQRLVLADDRRTLHNQMTVRKWGVRVARVDERIRKVG